VLVNGPPITSHVAPPSALTWTSPKSLRLKLYQCQNRSRGFADAAGTSNEVLLTRRLFTVPP
jgi:hypothetical protein